MPTNHYKVIPPNKLDKYYISTKNGGYSEYSVRDTRTGYTLPNCTAFAEGWFNKEYSKLTGKKDGIHFSFNGNACNFYNDAKRLGLERGQEMREGCLICWSGGKGHIAVCNQVFSDGTIEICESNYSGGEFKRFITSNSNGRWGMSSAYKFEGCIYNPSIKEIGLPSPVEKNNRRDQIRILKSSLRVRTYPSLKDEIIGLAKIGYYNYTETKESDGYTWYKIGEWNWIADVKGTTDVIPSFKVGDVVRIKEGTPVRITIKRLAYECNWEIKKIYLNGRVVLKMSGSNIGCNVKYDALYRI